MIFGYFTMILNWRHNKVSFRLFVIDTDPRPGILFFHKGKLEKKK